MTSTDRRSSPREVRRRSPGAARLLLLSHNSTRKSMFRPKVLGHTVGRRAEFDTIREFIRNGTVPVLCSDRAAVVTVDWDGGSNLAGTLVRNRMDAPPEDRQGRAFLVLALSASSSSAVPPAHDSPGHDRHNGARATARRANERRTLRYEALGEVTRKQASDTLASDDPPLN